MDFLIRNKYNSFNNYWSWALDGNLQNNEESCNMQSTNLICNGFSKSIHKSEMPFSVPNNMKRKFENFTKYISNKEHNFMKDTMDQLHQMSRSYSEYFTAQKIDSYDGNSIASCIIGGFVGSKSQMNNEKHKLSYDLSEVILKILNGCKCDKQVEKFKVDKKTDMAKAGRKSKRELYEPFGDYNLVLCNKFIDESFVIKNANNPVNTDAVKSSIGDENNKILEPVIEHVGSSFTPLAMTKINFGKEICQSSPANDKDCSDTHLINNNRKECCEISAVNTLESSEIQEVNNNNSPSNISMNFMSVDGRRRLHSECSIESTDSESFIVFDDKCYVTVDSSYEGLHCVVFQETENDESDIFIEEEDGCDNADDDNFCWIRNCDECDTSEDNEVAEANIRWSESYKGITTNYNERERKVMFSDDVRVYKMIAWDYAYRAARPGPWEQMARDRSRFKERINRLENIISPVLRQSHRKSIYDKLYN